MVTEGGGEKEGGGERERGHVMRGGLCGEVVVEEVLVVCKGGVGGEGLFKPKLFKPKLFKPKAAFGVWFNVNQKNQK
jgi:hypothetical protein